MSRPTIVCLCGSTRFGAAFREANLRETLAGRIVLSIGCEWHGDQALGLTREDKARLDELHLRKIDLADIVKILNVGGYVGDSTRRELAYAREHGKAIEWLEPPDDTCSVCGTARYTTCDDCDKQICHEHTQQWQGWCQWHLLLCPDCYAARAIAQARKD